MDAKAAFWIGLAGSVVTAVCCFTPVLVFVFGAVGLTALLVWTDLVLLPVLGAFLILTAVAAFRMRKPS